MPNFARMKHIFKALILLTFFCNFNGFNQAVGQTACPDDLGAWYMYFGDFEFKNSRFGIQGDLQHRNFDLGGDMQQIMLRAGATYRPKYTQVKLTLGLASITGGEYGDGDATTHETRIYQEALIPNKIGNRIYLKHRFRYEQRFIENNDMRTRYRYNLFLNLPLNSMSIQKNTVYLALYNELFINGEQNIGNGNTVDVFALNRTYGALGFGLRDNLNVQIGMMRQSTTSCYKDQLQISLHHKI